MPDFPIIDSHVHLYDVERFRYPWLHGVPKLKQTSLMTDLDRERGAVEIEKIVFVEVAIAPGLHLDEAAFVQELRGLATRVVAIEVRDPEAFTKALRLSTPAIVARVHKGRVAIDPRCLLDGEADLVVRRVTELLDREAP